MSRTPGTSTLRLSVWPRAVNSQEGIRRSAPSAKPMYQSGCDPAEAADGSYGPYIQIGLMVTKAAIRAVAPKTMKKKPPALAR